jgi:Holliday junction resolvase RusA-like endonuclease
VSAAPIVLDVDGDARGVGRPRFGRGLYAPATTLDAERARQVAWLRAGQPRLPAGPFTMTLAVNVKRHASHMLRGGQLSTEGLRHGEPTRRPDLDNVAKLIGDALNGLVYKDDAQLVGVQARRQWSDEAFVEVRMASVTTELV